MRLRGLVGVGLAMTAVLVALSSLVVVNAMARQTVNEVRSYPFNGKTVSIELTVGEVQILPRAEEGEISVRRRLTYGLRRPDVAEWIDGDTFRIRDGECPMPVGAMCHVRWLVEVPRNLHVVITTKTGDITVRGLAGSVNLISQSGAVKAVGLSGQAVQLLSHEGPVTGTDIRSSHVVATSRTGDIQLTFRTAPKLVRGHTTTGSVGVLLPDGDEAYKVSAYAGSFKTIATVKQDDEANRSIWVRSDKGAVTVEQNPPNPVS